MKKRWSRGAIGAMIFLLGCGGNAAPERRDSALPVVIPAAPSDPVEPTQPYDLQFFALPRASSEYFPESGKYRARNAADTYLGLPWDHSDYVMWMPKPWDADPWIAFEWLEPVRIEWVGWYDHARAGEGVRSGTLTLTFADGTTKDYAFGAPPDDGQSMLRIDTADSAHRAAVSAKLSGLTHEGTLAIAEIVVRGTRAPAPAPAAANTDLAPYARISEVTSTYETHYPGSDTGDYRGYFVQDGDAETNWLARWGDAVGGMRLDFDLPRCVRAVELEDGGGFLRLFDDAKITLDSGSSYEAARAPGSALIRFTLPKTARAGVRGLKIEARVADPQQQLLGFSAVRVLACDPDDGTDVAVAIGIDTP